jgi:hypothetical protein
VDRRGQQILGVRGSEMGRKQSQGSDVDPAVGEQVVDRRELAREPGRANAPVCRILGEVQDVQAVLVPWRG